jgi:hypothetical protein
MKSQGTSNGCLNFRRKNNPGFFKPLNRRELKQVANTKKVVFPFGEKPGRD